MADLKAYSPIDGSLVLERQAATAEEIREATKRARQAGEKWSRWPLTDRIEVLTKFIDAFVEKKEEIARELTLTMGRPLRFAGGEVGGFEERGRAMLRLAPEALAELYIAEGRFVQRLPVGVVLVVAAWNYPYLIAVNSVLPALAAGNSVLLKHSTQTMVCAERFAEAFTQAGLPQDVFQVLHMAHEGTEQLVASGCVDLTMFTGSVGGGRAIHRAAAGTFNPVGLELGGKDPAYVREDANLDFAAASLAEGAFFNSGQSCCAVERIYVHEKRYEEFLDLLCRASYDWKLGDPLDPNITLGPMIRSSAADFVRQQIEDAKADGAQTLLNIGGGEGAYLPPEILIDVRHDMSLMMDESFGPVVGVMPVASDEEALLLMNDSPFGLTASLWTEDLNRARALGKGILAGTIFCNRCDYLDPNLAWTGFKDSGRGCTLSKLGYEHLTRPKSFHLRPVP